MIKIKCSRKRYLVSGVTLSVFLIVTVVCIIFITQRRNESDKTRVVYSIMDDTSEASIDHVHSELILESESSDHDTTQSVSEAMLIPRIHINEEQEHEEPENSSNIFTQSSARVSIQSILRAILIPQTHNDDENEELENSTFVVSTQLSSQSKEQREISKVRTICAKQERDQIKRHRDEEHAQLLRIRESEHEFREIEHAQLFDMLEKEKVSLEEEHDLKMKILSEKLFYYQGLNNNKSIEVKT